MFCVFDPTDLWLVITFFYFILIIIHIFDLKSKFKNIFLQIVCFYSLEHLNHLKGRACHCEHILPPSTYSISIDSYYINGEWIRAHVMNWKWISVHGQTITSLYLRYKICSPLNGGLHQPLLHTPVGLIYTVIINKDIFFFFREVSNEL